MTGYIKKITGLIFLLIIHLLVYGQEINENSEFAYGKRLQKEGLFDLASLQFQEFADKYPNNPQAGEAQFLSAECYFALRQYPNAQKGYLKTIVQFPDSPYCDRAQFRIAECYEIMGNKEEALLSYNRVSVLFPGSQWGNEALYKSAELAYNLDRFKKADLYLSTLLDKADIGGYQSRGILLRANILIRTNKAATALQILNNMVKTPIGSNDRGEGLLKIAFIYEKLGQYHESISYLRNLLNDQNLSKFYQSAWFLIGQLFHRIGEPEDAVKAFQNVLLTGEDDQKIFKANYHLAEIKVNQNRCKDALDDLAKINVEKVPPEDHFKIQFLKVRCLIDLNRSDQAISECERISREPLLAKSNKIENRLILADLYTRTGLFFDAIRLYRHICSTDTLPDRMKALIQFKIGKIYLKEMDQLHEALIHFNNVWLIYPDSPIAPEAYYLYAQALEKTEQIENATKYYKRITTQYKHSQWAKKAHNRLMAIEFIQPQNNMTLIIKMLEKAVGRDYQQNDHYYLAVLLGRDLKKFQQSESYFKQYITDNPGSALTDSILYWRANNYFGIYISNNNSAYLDSALSFLYMISSDSSNTNWKTNIIEKIITWADWVPIQKRYEIYANLVQKERFAQSPEIIMNYGLTALELDSLKKAQELWYSLPSIASTDVTNPNIWFYQGKIAYLNNDFKQADSLLLLYQSNAEAPDYNPETSYYLAQIRKMKGNLDDAVYELNTILTKFPYSSEAIKAKELLGKIYLDSKNYEQASHLFQEELYNDSLTILAVKMNLIENIKSNRNKWLLGLAQALEMQNKLKEAKDMFLKYRSENVKESDKINAFTALSRISEKEGDIQLAADYLQKCFEISASDSIAGLLGEFYTRLGNYDKGISAYEKASQLSEDIMDKAKYDFGIILCMLQQGKIPQAEVRMDVYMNSYKSLEATKKRESEYFLKKGIVHTDNKDFQLALDAFNTIRNKYRKTVFVPDAELEIGRVNLITNKIDDALKILTDMPQKYPDHPVLSKVYLNLGDHYYRSQQYQNAISAFKKVIEIYPDSEVDQLAMRYLIRVYDSIRLWDSALALTRRYLEKFPQADDFLQKQVQIGIFYMNLHEYRRAIEVFQEVKKVADYETEAEIQYWIGKCYGNLGQFQQSIFEFLKVKYLSRPTKLPWASTALYEAALTYLRLDKPEEAKKIFEKIVQSEGAASDLGRIARQKIDEIESQKQPIEEDR